MIPKPLWILSASKMMKDEATIFMPHNKYVGSSSEIFILITRSIAVLGSSLVALKHAVTRTHRSAMSFCD